MRISPHYRSVGRRQGSCGVFGGCSTLSADLAKSNAFIIKYIGRHLRRYKMGRRGEQKEDPPESNAFSHFYRKIIGKIGYP